MKDFPDWLSPIAVKELRQGLKTRAFVGIFLLLQLGMILCIGISLMAGNPSETNRFFWSFLMGALLMGVPFRGVLAVAGEAKAKTLELLLLTRLSPWKIIFGKWAALVFQSGLLVCAILPYVVLRYFLGGVNLAVELLLILLIFWAGLILTGIAVAGSAFADSLVGRIALGFGVWLGLSMVPGFFMRRGGPSILPTSWLEWSLGFVVPLFLMLILFEFGVTRISPPGESNADRKRLLALGGVMLVSLLGWISGQREFCAWAAFVLAAPVCFASWMEPVHPIPALYRPNRFLPRFPGFGWIGKMFCPGWPGGLLFSFLIMIVLWLASDAKLRPGMSGIDFYRLVASIGIALMPLAVVWSFVPQRLVVLMYFGIQGICSALGPILLELPLKKIPSAIFLLPLTGFSLSLSSKNSTPVPTMIFFTAITASISLIVLVILSAKQWRKIKALQKMAEEDPVR